MRLSRRTLLAAGTAAAASSTLTGCAVPAARPLATERLPVGPTPFDMPALTLPVFTGRPRFTITDFGARVDSQAATSAALAAAIAAAHGAGGGTVIVPPGRWPTGPVHLKSRVELHLKAGATLHFSSDPADYLPAVQASWEGLECMIHSPLVYAFGAEDIAVSGAGTLEAGMDVWTQWFTRPKSHMDALVALYRMSVDGVPATERRMTDEAFMPGARLRPPFLHFNRCQRVRLEGVRIVNSPFWTVHPFLCEDVLIRGISIRAHGHNNDGIDPEMSQRVLIEDCTFDQGDDAISVKSGRERDGWRLATPSRHIVVRRCKVLNGHQLMAIGSELAGGVSEVLVEDCEVDNRASTHKVQLFNLLFVKTNERRGGHVRNIHLRRVKAHRLVGSVLDVDMDVLYQWRTLMPTLEKRLTPIEGVFVSDVEVAEAQHVSRLRGEASLPVRGVRIRRVRVQRLLGGAHDHRHAQQVDIAD
ncbi:glycoside hydrolase family 28 protein [Pelomonas sp. UHG3]|uniref:Glycoside hydrolase family 28 protein n=1 Tax=Roseateles hydrophilus TaxID=2975054 RepID=A0ACC6C4X5_9BURK|nr:glycoside hydrolase family 28 protein [Pelomonas sp. UHG3]MCY4743429.1 glycoside hydrolase family 28 protein [Pelomonas sp. UHG3]